MSGAQAVDFRGMPAMAWSSADGARAIATLQGAHLVSWTLPGGEERLFLSERSAFVPGRAVRGGVPVIFPQFADRGPLAQHGFARTQPWRFAGVGETPTGCAASFVLEATQETAAIWPHRFRLELVAAIGGARLEMELRVSNGGAGDFAFTAALHTYLRVSDAFAVRLEGLQGVRYLTRGASAAALEERKFVTAAEPVDRTYFAPPGLLYLADGARRLRLVQRGFTDTVVWNPGRDTASRMADMAPDGFRRMLCVEAAAIEPAVVLHAGGEWSGTQVIEALG